MSLTTPQRAQDGHEYGADATYDVFLSYSHSADVRLAPELQRLIRRVGRAWYSRATLRIFRDTTNLPMSENLWSSIEAALKQSRTFVLLASPAAAASPWVNREVRFWREHRERGSLVIALTSGQITWDQDAGDFAASCTAVPPALRGWYDDEPSWLDLRPAAQITTRRGQRNDRVRDAARTIAAPLYGLEKDQLEGEDERESRRARRTLFGGAVALALLTVVALVSAVMAVGQANTAKQQARVALAGQLAAVSTTNRASAMDLAGLLAVQAHVAEPNVRSRAALLGAATTAGQLVRFVPMPAKVVDVAASKDGSVVVAGLLDGTVWRWRTAEQSPEQVATLQGPVLAVATSANGDFVAAGSEAGLMVSRPGAHPLIVKDKALSSYSDLALSDSGRTMIYTVADSEAAWVDVLKIDDDAASEVDRRPGPYGGRVVTTDDEATILNSSSGVWERRHLSDWSLLTTGQASFTNAQRDMQIAPTGESIIYAQDTTPYAMIWRTGEPSPQLEPSPSSGETRKAPYTLEAPVGSADAVALSLDGATGAVADTGVIHVGPIAPANEARAVATELVGVGSIDTGSLRFLGNNRLVASSGARLVLWDLMAIDRLATAAAVPMDSGCHACGPPQVDLSPDGRLAFVPDNFGADNFQLVSLPELTVRDRFAVNGENHTYQGSSWTRDGDLVVLVLGQTPDDPPPPPVKLLHVDQRVVAVGGGPANSDVVAIMADGRVLRFDATTGASVEVAPAVTDQLASGPGSEVPVASVGSTGLAAFTQGTVVTTIDPESGRSGSRDMLEDVTAVEIAGTKVLIRTSRGIGVWDRTLTRLERTISGDVTGDGRWAPVASPTGRFVAQPREDSSVSLIDVKSGFELTSFRATLPGLRTGIAFSSDDSRIITIAEPAGGYGVSENGTLVARSISDDALIRSACATAGRDLTQAEWSQAVDAQPPDSLACPL